MRVAIACMPLCLMLLTSGPAQAGNGSALNVLGFSADGRYFAFEQYGERNSDGQLFSEIVTIAVRDDRPEEGPIVETWQPEPGDRRRTPMTLEQVRQRAAAKAGPTLKRLAIGAHGVLVAEALEGQARDVLGAARTDSVRAAALPALSLAASAFGSDAQLSLREFAIPVRRCQTAMPEGKAKAIALTLERAGRTPLTLTLDRNIPVQRGCPDRYGLVAAHVLPRPDGSIALAVVIQYFYAAEGGPDRRFFAVTAAVR